MNIIPFIVVVLTVMALLLYAVELIPLPPPPAFLKAAAPGAGVASPVGLWGANRCCIASCAS